MRVLQVLLLLACPVTVLAQGAGKFPPDSLVNTKIIPHSTPVQQVIGTMRNFTSDLGVRCPFCHVGQEGAPLSQFDFPSDQKRTKLVARQMMAMVQEINRRIDTIPARPASGVEVTCGTCHRGVNRPAPLWQVMVDAVNAGGLDSATRAYRALRERYYGRGAYDFGEGSLNTAAFRLARANRAADALSLLTFNEGLFPGSSGMAVFRGNIYLMRNDTSAAEAAFREAIRRDSTNGEARGRLRAIGRTP